MNDPQPTPSTPSNHRYENNPFYVATNGLELLFKKAQTIGIVLAVFAVASALSSLPSMFGGQSPADTDRPSGTGPAAEGNLPLEAWLVIGGIILLVLIVAVVIGIIVKGICDVTAARLSQGQTITLSEAFRAVFENFWGYLWVTVIVSVKTLLWTLLFILPGIVMAVRYSLAGVAFFDKGLRGDAAVQRSSQLVKGAWSTTFASQTLFNVITFGALQTLLYPGTNAVLYGQLTAVGEAKPKPHLLSVITVWIVMTLFVLLVLAFLLLIPLAYMNYQRALS